jgi:hypothetical protein
VSVGCVKRKVRGGDGPALQRGVHDVRKDAGLCELLTATHGLNPALVGEVDVDPSGEEVLGVPLTLAVSKQDEGEGFASV